VRWVRRMMGRYDSVVGMASLCARSSRPQCSPQQIPPEISRAICVLKQAHGAWWLRRIAKQVRWQWRTEPECQHWVNVGRMRRVLVRHPELDPLAPASERIALRHVGYLTCNLIWVGDIHETPLPDGHLWCTLHWLNLHSRFELSQLTAQRLSEALVVRSFLDIAQQ